MANKYPGYATNPGIPINKKLICSYIGIKGGGEATSHPNVQINMHE